MKPHYQTWSKQDPSLLVDVASAEGSFFVTSKGRRVFDFCSTSFQSHFGHSFSPIVNAIQNQLKQLPIASPKMEHDLKTAVGAKLKDYLKQKNGKIFYTVSGAEAVENALKMARQVSGKTLVVSREDSYHGATLGALSITGDWRHKDHALVDHWTLKLPSPLHDPDFSESRRRLEGAGIENIAAFCFESISGANGVVPVPTAWWQEIQKIRDQHGTLLICDEILTGFHRTSTRFAFEQVQVKPDFICLAKGISGGYVPFGAVWTSEPIVNHFEERVLSAGLTNYAHPLGLAATNAVLETLTDINFLDHRSKLETVFAKQCQDLAQTDVIKSYRQQGLLAAFDLNGEIPSWKEFWNRGLFVYVPGDRIVIGPPLNSRIEDVETGFETIKTLLR